MLFQWHAGHASHFLQESAIVKQTNSESVSFSTAVCVQIVHSDSEQCTVFGCDEQY